MPFSRALAWNEKQTASLRILIRVNFSICYNGNRYASSNTIPWNKYWNLKTCFGYFFLMQWLTGCKLTQRQKYFLKLGLNCYLLQVYTHIIKNREIEILFQNFLKHQNKKVISIKLNSRHLLKAEVIRIKYNKINTYSWLNNEKMPQKNYGVTLT